MYNLCKLLEHKIYIRDTVKVASNVGKFIAQEYSPPSPNLVFSISRVYRILSLLSLFICILYLDSSRDILLAVRILGGPGLS